MTANARTRGVFIVIDGVDGAGKTSVAQSFAASISAYYYKSPAEPYASKRHTVDVPGVNPVVRYRFYREANQNDSDIIGKILDQGQHVICDRYYFSTYAHHVVLDENVKDIFNTDGLLEPDLAVLVMASSECRRTRLANRKDAIKPMEKDHAYQDKVQLVLESMGMLKIDTEKNNFEQVNAIIMDEIRRIRPGF